MKTKKIKSASPIYGAAAAWLLMGVVCPGLLMKMWFLPVAALISATVYFVLSRIFKGRVIEVRKTANSGDKAIDALIAEAQRSRARAGALLIFLLRRHLRLRRLLLQGIPRPAVRAPAHPSGALVSSTAW